MATGDATRGGHNRFVSFRQRDHLTFSGDASQDVDDWLADFERVSSHNVWDNTLKLANVVFYLAGTARTWFQNHEADIQSWDTLRATIATSFAVSNNRQRLSSDRLATRAQHEAESFTAYIEDVLWLCRRANPGMDEHEKLSHLMKGVAEDAFQFLIRESPSTVTDFSATCKMFEDSRRSCLNKPQYHRLPNVPASFSSPETDAPDIPALVREVVREELRVVLPEYYPSSFDARLPDISLKEAIRDEVRAALSEMPKLSPEEFRNGAPTVHRPPTPSIVAAYSEGQREPNRGFVTPPHYRCDQSQPHTHRFWVPPDHSTTRRRTDIWRSDDFRPICFYYRRPGHVYRFCKQRINDLSYSQSRYEFGGRDNNRHPSENYTSVARYCSPSRNQPSSRSPSPSQRRRTAACEGQAAEVAVSIPHGRPRAVPGNTIWMTVDGQKFECLIDTGAAVSTFRDDLRRYLRKVLTRYEGKILRSADRSLIPARG